MDGRELRGSLADSTSRSIRTTGRMITLAISPGNAAVQ
jgi:hypothetical protein